MVRNRKKKSLYEVIGKTWRKPSYDKTLEQPHPEEYGKDRPIAPYSTMRMRVPGRAARWPKRPRIVQFNAGRIEISMPYPIAIALLLGVVLLALIVFRLGQFTRPGSQEVADSAAKMPENMQKVAPEATAGAPQRPDVAEEVEPVKLKGNNRIVIQTYQLRAHLEPVKQYFALFGIETEIKKIDDWYYLVTTDKYDNPEKPGTDGYLAKQKIIEWGAKYKAPLGYETFGSKPFHDAYGIRLD